MISIPTLFLSVQYRVTRHLSTLTDILNQRLNSELDSIRQAGTWKNERIISTSQSSHIRSGKFYQVNF